MIGVYGYEHFLIVSENDAVIEKGRATKNLSLNYYLPSSTTGQVIHHQGYSLSYSEPHEQAEWVAYELKRAHLKKSHHKRPYFEVDKAVSTGAADWRNYKNSGYDRGHLCPAGDRNYSKAAHDETFLTSNVSPQDPKFNAGIWSLLEKKVRRWAKRYDGVYVVTGGVLTNNLEIIGSEKVAVPKKFYKVIYDPQRQKMIAFLMPNKNSKQPLTDFIITVDSLEILTGIDFFPNLEDNLEDQLEANRDYSDWSF